MRGRNLKKKFNLSKSRTAIASFVSSIDFKLGKRSKMNIYYGITDCAVDKRLIQMPAYLRNLELA